MTHYSTTQLVSSMNCSNKGRKFRSHLPVHQNREGAIRLALEVPASNLWRVAFLAVLALLAGWSGPPFVTGPATRRQQLPAVAGAYSRIVALGNERSTVERNDVELSVFFIDIECTAHALPALLTVLQPTRLATTSFTG